MKKKNIIFINELKIIATILVFLGHLFSTFKITIFQDNSKFFYIQYFGVAIFLIVSGFLLMESLKKNGDKIKIFDYFVHRNRKTYLIYLCALFFVLITDTVLQNISSAKYKDLYNDFVDTSSFSGYSIGSFLVTALYISRQPKTRSILGFIIPSINEFGTSAQLWYMCVWFWLSTYITVFYYSIVLPLKKSMRIEVAKLAVVFIFSLFIYYYIGVNHTSLPFLFGCLSNVLYQKINIKEKYIIFIRNIAFCIAIAIMIYTKYAYNVFATFFLSISFLFANVLFFNNNESVNSYKCNLIAYSLPVYLTHHTIFIWMVIIFGTGYRSAFVAVLVSIFVAIVFRFVSNNVVEFFNNFKLKKI